MIKIKKIDLEKLRGIETKTAIAKKLGLTRQTYSRIEEVGIGALRLEFLPAFIKALDLSISDVIEIDGKGISEIEKIMMKARELRIKEQFADLRSFMLEHENFILDNYKDTKFNKEFYIYRAVAELTKEIPFTPATKREAEVFFDKASRIKGTDYLTETIFFRELAGLQALGYHNLEKASAFLLKALESFEKITESHTDLHIAILSTQYHLLSKLDKYDRAESALEQLLKISTDSTHLHRLGNVWYLKVLDCLARQDLIQAEKYLKYVHVYAEFASASWRKTAIDGLYKMLDLARMGVYEYNGKVLNAYGLSEFEAIYREYLSDPSFKKRLLNFYKHRSEMEFAKTKDRLENE